MYYDTPPAIDNLGFSHPWKTSILFSRIPLGMGSHLEREKAAPSLAAEPPGRSSKTHKDLSLIARVFTGR